MKNSLKVAGLMSGTSMDGLDCCIADVSIDSNFIFDYNIISQKSFQFNQVTKNKIRQYIGETKIDRLNEIDKFMGESFLNLSKFFLSNHPFDYIAIHGQTIHHKDKIKSIQIGDPIYLATYFKVPVIYNFRKKDIELGGTGAPLMPFLDWLFFRKKGFNIIALNLGGISNISVINQDCNKSDVVGFDTGPGMSLIDECVRKFWGEEYDKNGKYSSQGKIVEEMLDYLINDVSFIIKTPPKSTGREDFGEKYLNKIIKRYKNLSPFDIIRTLVKFSSISIKLNLEKFIFQKFKIDKLIISGGGANHPILINDIRKDLDTPVFNVMDYGVESKFKESLLMAVLGYAKIKNIKSNMPTVTGALKDVVLGEVCEFK